MTRNLTPAQLDEIEAAASSGVAVTRIGRLVAGTGVAARTDAGIWRPARAGHEHFASP